jgi:hypothetical protein
MVATGAHHPSEPAGLVTGRRIPTIIRRVLARRKSLSALLYVISTGLIATWIIGVFLGLGFFLLVHEPQRSISGSEVGDRPRPALEGDHPVQDASGRLTDEPLRLNQPVPQAAVTPPPSSGQAVQSDIGSGDLSAPAPQNQNAGAIDRPGLMAAEPGKEQTIIDHDRGVPSADIGTTFGSLGEVAAGPPRGQPSGAAEQRRRAAKLHKRHQRPLPAARAHQTHPPVQAIHDVLHKHSRLLR